MGIARPTFPRESYYGQAKLVHRVCTGSVSVYVGLHACRLCLRASSKARHIYYHRSKWVIQFEEGKLVGRIERKAKALEKKMVTMLR